MTDERAPFRDLALVLRADASAEGGTGHMMRTLALTQAWLDGGGHATWLVADAPPSLLERIEREDVRIVRLEPPAGSGEDAACLRETLLRESTGVGVVDGDRFGSAYLASLGDTGSRVLVIDDAGERPAYPVGFVLNQNAHADRAAYPADATSRFLLGTRYALLRREFVAAPPPRDTPRLARHLLVTFGGADPTGMTARTVRAMRRLPARIRETIEVRVIVGAANPDGPHVETVLADPTLGYRAVLERAVDDMPAQMAWADLAITSGGSTVWELARTGCPALIVETVPVERLLVSGLARVGLFGHLGPEDELDERDLADEIAAKAEDMAWRVSMTALGMRLIDGDGARRVAGVLAGRSDVDEEQT